MSSQFSQKDGVNYSSVFVTKKVIKCHTILTKPDSDKKIITIFTLQKNNIFCVKMKQKWRFLIGKIFLFILKHFLTIKQKKIKNRKTGEKFKVANFIGFFGLYDKIDLAQNTENVEFGRSGRHPWDNDSTITTVSELENDPEHKNFNFVSKCKYFFL